MRSLALRGINLGEGFETHLLQLSVDFDLSSSGKATLDHAYFPNRVGDNRQQ